MTAIVPAPRRLPVLARRPGDAATARLLAKVTAGPPAPYTRDQIRLPTFTAAGPAQQLSVYGAEPTLTACVSHLAATVSQVEWRLYRRAASGRREDRIEVASHAALDLWYTPNARYTSTTQEFLEVTEQHLELTGMAYWAIGTHPQFPRLPLSLWPVRPDRLEPVPSPDRFRDGWIYRGPDGRDTAFADDEVIALRFPDPMDPYHGLGPVRALLPDLEGARFQTEWARNFFKNSALPGGIISVEESLTDPEFDELRERWAELHQGTANAGRVAILERGMTWTDRSYSMKDMEFASLQGISDARIMLAFGLSKVLLGQTESVNRATAQAAEYIFAKYRLRPRLERIKQVLNRQLLPRFDGGDQLEFDYEPVVTGDVEEDARERDSKVSAASQLVALGVDPAAALAAVGLPDMALTASADADGASVAPPREQAEMVQKIYLGVGTVITWEEARAVLVRAGLPLDLSIPAPVVAARPAIEAHARPAIHAHRRVPVRPRNAGDPPDVDPADLPDITRLQEKFDEILDRLLVDWAVLEDAQKAALVAQVLAIADAGSVADLEGLEVDTEAAAELLAAAMLEIAEDAADAVVEEAEEQGVKLTPAEVDADLTRDVAGVVAGLVAGRLIGGAAAAAMRANGGRATPEQVAGAVEEHLAGLSTDGPRRQLAGALTGSQNEARSSTIRRGPAVAVYAHEKNDARTCPACRAVDGKWLGNYPEDADAIEALYPGGAYGGYVDCEGRELCRGTIAALWRAKGRK